MAVTYSADQVALLINTLTARNGNEFGERLPRGKSKGHDQSSSRSSTNNIDDDGAAKDQSESHKGTEQKDDLGEGSTKNGKRRSRGQESNSSSPGLTPPPPLKKRGPKPLKDKPASVCASRIV